MGCHILQKVAMALVVRGTVRFEWISSLSDEQISKWLAKSELAFNLIRPVRDRLGRQKDQSDAEANSRAEILEDRKRKGRLSKPELLSLASEDRIGMLHNMIEDSAKNLGVQEVFDNRPTKVFDMLARLPNEDSARDLLNMRADCCFLSAN